MTTTERKDLTARAAALFVSYVRECDDPLDAGDVDILWRAALKTAWRPVDGGRGLELQGFTRGGA